MEDSLKTLKERNSTSFGCYRMSKIVAGDEATEQSGSNCIGLVGTGGIYTYIMENSNTTTLL